MPLLSPITAKELRPLLRSRQAFWFLLLALLAIGGVFWLYWVSQIGDMQHPMSRSETALYGRELFLSLAMGLLCVLGLISPIITATAITTERENKTLDLLFCSGLKRRQIILGKLWAGLAYQLLLVVCMTPILILPFQLGGIGTDEILWSALIILTTVVTYGMLGLAVSSWMRKTAAALVVAILLVLILAVFIPILMINCLGLLNIIINNPMPEVFTSSPLFIFFVRIFCTSGGRPVASVSNLGLHFAFQAALLMICWFLARRGLARRKSSERHAIARKIIDDPALLDQRRHRWPYYLIDPQRRAQNIADGANPVLIKEKRTGVLARPTVLIRLGYAAAFISLMGLVYLMLSSVEYSRDDDPFRSSYLPWIALGLLGPLTLFILTQAATALTREHEEKTLDLLRVTLLSPRRIVGAKFRIVMRFAFFVCLSLIALPIVLLLFSLPFISGKYDQDLSHLISVISMICKAMVFTLAFAAFYSALGIYWSSRCRRNLTALILSYLSALGLLALPFFVWLLNQVYESYQSRWGISGNQSLPILQGSISFSCRLISPLYYFMANYFDRHLDEMQKFDAWSMLLIHAALLMLISWCLLRLAAHRMAKTR